MSLLLLGFAVKSLALICPKGHYAVGNICVDCATGMRWCVLCTGPGQCTHCQPGYYIDKGYCKPCDSSCVACSGPNSCTTCQSSYCKNSSGSCIEPGEVYEGCRRCAFETNKCIECHEGYFFNTAEATCTKCKENCLRCKNATECEEPSSGYHLDKNSGTITPCTDTNCSKCSTSASTCDTCIDGYGFNPENVTDGSKGTCTACTIKGCKKCSTISTCEACKEQYAFSNGSCIPCADNCRFCMRKGTIKPGKCNPNGCFSGYRYDPGTRTCVMCPKDCSLCEYNASLGETICESCKNTSIAIAGPGIYGVLCAARTTKNCSVDSFQENEDCVRCASFIIGCQQCSDKFHCTKCMTGFYLIDNICVACNSDCFGCDITPSNCTSCRRNSVLQGNICAPVGAVIPNCISATPGKKEATCQECASGYYIKDNACLKCVENCALCRGDNTSDCLVAKAGYRVNRIDKIIEKCNIENCMDCILGVGSCSLCNEGYALGQDKNSCVMGAVSNCNLYFTSKDKCGICKSGYGLSGPNNDMCEPCQKECVGDCFVASSCSSSVCIEGYYYSYDTFKCAACPSGCSLCKQYQDTNPGCTRCKSGATIMLAPNYGLHCDALPTTNLSTLQGGAITAIVILVFILIGLCIAMPFVVKTLVKKKMFRKTRAIKFDHGSADSLLPEGSGSAL